jgi:hypothetical protein
MCIRAHEWLALLLQVGGASPFERRVKHFHLTKNQLSPCYIGPVWESGSGCGCG